MNKKMFWAAGIAILATGCSPKATSADTPSGCEPVQSDVAMYIPRATVFKMSGPYADKVAVSLDASGNLSYFPAPSDITEASKPVYVGNGWWLNRQGLGPSSVFTSWTFEEYSALPATPTVSEIKAHIIPGAEVTDFERTNVALPDAMNELGKIRAIVAGK